MSTRVPAIGNARRHAAASDRSAASRRPAESAPILHGVRRVAFPAERMPVRPDHLAGLVFMSALGIVRIVEPSDGRFVHAGQPFLVRVEQRIRGGPLQGRGRVQVEAEGSGWRDLGEAFPWTRQGGEFSTFATVRLPGIVRLRVVVSADERDPLFETDPVEIHVLGRTRSAATPGPAASRGALRGPPPR